MVIQRAQKIVTITLLGMILLISGAPATTLTNQTPSRLQNSSQNWLYTARIAGGIENTEFWNYGGIERDPLEMSQEEWDQAFQNLVEQGVNTVDLDLGLYYYETFLDPSEEINAMQKAVIAAHKHNMKIFAYQAGFEMQTENADQKSDTVFKTHPDWIQRGVNGEYAVYNSSFAFWIAPGDEDVWVTPLNQEWREQYLTVAKQVVATGIDGFYIDVPYFIDWSFEWGSFDPYMKSEFYNRTGLHAPTEQEFSMTNENFRKWLSFREDIIVEFLQEVKTQITQVNPNVKLITEIYGGYAQYAIRYGAEIEKITQVVDVITHEFGLYGDEGAVDYYAPQNWLFHVAILTILKGIDNSHPTWMLQYGTNEQDVFELGSASIAVGTNFWETKLPDMLSSANEQARKTMFAFIKENQDYLYGNWSLENPVLLYYSGTTKTMVGAMDDPIVEQSSWDEATGEDYLNYFGDSHVQDLIGITMMLLANHIPVQIVTKHTFKNYSGEGTPLILPSVKAMSNAEIQMIQAHVGNNNPLILSGENAKYDEAGNQRNDNPLSNISTVQLQASIGRTYLESLLKQQEVTSIETQLLNALDQVNYQPPFSTTANKNTVVLPYTNNGTKIVRIFNFDGVKKEMQIPRNYNITVDIAGKTLKVPVKYFTVINVNNNTYHEVPTSLEQPPATEQQSQEQAISEESAGFLHEPLLEIVVLQTIILALLKTTQYHNKSKKA